MPTIGAEYRHVQGVMYEYEKKGLTAGPRDATDRGKRICADGEVRHSVQSSLVSSLLGLSEQELEADVSADRGELYHAVDARLFANNIQVPLEFGSDQVSVGGAQAEGGELAAATILSLFACLACSALLPLCKSGVPMPVCRVPFVPASTLLTNAAALLLTPPLAQLPLQVPHAVPSRCDQLMARSPLVCARLLLWCRWCCCSPPGTWTRSPRWPAC